MKNKKGPKELLVSPYEYSTVNMNIIAAKSKDRELALALTMLSYGFRLSVIKFVAFGFPGQKLSGVPGTGNAKIRVAGCLAEQ